MIIDPKEQLVGLFFAQYQPADFPLVSRWQTLLYQAIAD